MPLIKLTTLAIKTLSKPLAKTLKARISKNDKLTQYCVSIGQGVHKLWSIVTIRAAGHKGLKIKPLEESAALTQGTEFISEVFIFSVAGACVVFEMIVSDNKKIKDNEKKKLKQMEKDNYLKETFHQINTRLNNIEKNHEELIKAIEKVEKEKESERGSIGRGGDNTGRNNNVTNDLSRKSWFSPFSNFIKLR